MSSTTAAKRIKLLDENEQKIGKNNITAESGFHSEIHFSSNDTTDFSLPSVKRKSVAPRRASLQQISLNSMTESTQQSSGYSSLFSSSSLTNTGSLTSLPLRTSRTPKKRKSEISESDENFYNSFQFVSPVKIPKRNSADENRAKILKEKSSSANVILCSTPIRTNNKSNKNTKWGKFRSFHPEKFHIGKSLDEAEPIEKAAICTPPIKSLAEDSINLSNIDFSNVSGNFSSSIQHDIPSNLQHLWTDDIKNSKHVSFNVCENATESQVKPTISSYSKSSPSDKRQFFNGRAKVDIIGKLHANNDIAITEILGYLDAETLLSLSHVCKDYRNMIQTNKNYETKRQNYLKQHRAIKENKLPSRQRAFNLTTENNYLNNTSIPDRKKKKAFGNYNINISLTKQKTPTPPQSPSSRRFTEMQKLIKTHKGSAFKPCPRCRKPAKINSLKIRNSPRKKKSTSCILKLSTSTGRVHKRARPTFLSKTSIPESFHEAVSNPNYVTISTLDDDSSRSPNRSSSCESPNSSGSDESCETDEIYEYGLCTSVGCSYKFCIKCNCKYHPRRICGDLSPPSPSRNNHSKVLAGTQASRKSLRRLINQY